MLGTTKNLSHDSRYQGRGSNGAALEYQSTELLLYQPTGYILTYSDIFMWMKFSFTLLLQLDISFILCRCFIHLAFESYTSSQAA